MAKNDIYADFSMRIWVYLENVSYWLPSEGQISVTVNATILHGPPRATGLSGKKALTILSSSIWLWPQQELFPGILRKFYKEISMVYTPLLL